MALSAEMAGELGAFPGYAANAEAHAAGDPQPPARGAGAPRPATRGWRCRRWRSTTPTARTARSSTWRTRSGTRRWSLGAAARLPQRPDHGDRADRHDRAGDGLRHHRHRARLRAGEVQEAGRRRLLQDHQPRGARGAGQPRLPAGGGRGDRRLRRRPRHARQRAGDQPDGADRPRLRQGGDREARGGAADRLRHPLRLQPVDARRGVLHRRARHPGGEAARPGLRPAAPPRLQPGADRGGEQPRLRHDDAGRRAAPEAGALRGLRLRQSLRQDRRSAISRSRATSG